MSEGFPPLTNAARQASVSAGRRVVLEIAEDLRVSIVSERELSDQRFKYRRLQNTCASNHITFLNLRRRLPLF